MGSTPKLGFALTIGTCLLFHSQPGLWDTWNKAFFALPQLAQRRAIFRSSSKTKHWFEKRQMFNFDWKKEQQLNFQLQKSSLGNKNWLRTTRQQVGRNEGKQIRTRFGRAVVKWVSICFHRKDFNAHFKKPLVKQTWFCGFPNTKEKTGN